jgi:hypothetical protein
VLVQKLLRRGLDAQYWKSSVLFEDLIRWAQTVSNFFRIDSGMARRYRQVDTGEVLGAKGACGHIVWLEIGQIVGDCGRRLIKWLVSAWGFRCS